MFTTFYNILRDSFKYKGTFYVKLWVFFILIKLRINSIFFSKRKTKVSTSIFKFKITAFNYRTIEFLFKDIFISNDYSYFPSTKYPIILDCGANIGMSVLYFKYLFPESKIIAFEANPHTFKLLTENIKFNQLTETEIHNVALYNKVVEIPFFISEDVGTLHASIRGDRGGASQMMIQGQKLSYFLKDYESVDLIKMDVEGAEWYILDDLIESSTISKAKQYIIEYHHNIGSDKSILSAFLSHFEKNGYNYNIKAKFYSINSFQDILIHFYKS